MTKLWTTLALLFAAASSGCTTVSLERYTLNQVQTSKEYQATQVLRALATVAANPDALPSFAILEDGTSRVQDMETLNAITIWTRALGSFASQNMAVTLNRMPSGQWTVDPVVEYEPIEALRAACQWVLYGPEIACKDRPGLLTDPEQDFSPGPHFGVADRLAHLPPGWLHVGRITEVPACACYKAHCGHTWVWVLPNGTQGLADFTLVLHDIATLNPTTGANPSPLLVTLTITDTTTQLKYQEIRMIRPECKHYIEEKIREALPTRQQEDKPRPLSMTLGDWLGCTVRYHGSHSNTSSQGGMRQQTQEPQSNTPLQMRKALMSQINAMGAK